MKKCYQCGHTKPVSDFSGIKKLSSECKKCALLRQLDIKERRREKHASVNRELLPDRRCPACGDTKPATMYFISRTCVDGVSTYCKPCTTEKNREAESRVPKEVKSRRTRNRWLRTRYGISEKEFDAMSDAQMGLCWICQGDAASRGGRRLVVDHDHRTGEIRGLLCAGCNRGIGALKDSSFALERAAEYVRNPPAISSNKTRHVNAYATKGAE